jgi:hypothetical protein
LWWNIGVVAIIVLFCGGAACLTYCEQIDHEFSLLEGRLYPGNDPIPPNECDKHHMPDYTLLLLGSNTFQIEALPIVLISVNGAPVVTLDENPDGSLQLNGELNVFSDGRIVAQLKDGTFSINPNNYSRKTRTRNRITVYDQQGDIALDARFLTKKAFSLNGKFYFKQYGPFSLERATPVAYRDNCATYSRGHGQAAIITLDGRREKR